ncbi:MAG: right-handed parallel beta-helix repeat-containing protein [Candidatus Zixiibacteriota bacterium]
MKKAAVLAAFIILLALSSSSLPPSDATISLPDGTRSIDNTTFIDANSILMFVTNHGNFGRDLSGFFGYDYGTFFPFTDTALISSGAETTSPLYASGLWIGGKVSGEIRVVVAEYDDEYVPGPMSDGTSAPDEPAFRVYKLYKDSLEDNPNSDYLSWPEDQGAPVDNEGKPIMFGDQMLWSVYNDADPTAHQNDAGMTGPLGLEVKHTTFAFDRDNDIDNIIFFRLCIINKGANTIDSCYFSLWADPDVGGAGDDFVGCDSLLSLGYAYNADDYDSQYGDTPPAVGYDFLQGPMMYTGNSTDTAGMWGQDFPRYKNLKMISFNKYINGTDPDNRDEVYNYMRGLNRDGTPYMYNGLPNNFVHSGDPVAGTGDIDSNPTDRRMMLSCGPLTFAPGDSTEIIAAIIIGSGSDNLNAVTVIRNLERFAQMIYENNFVIPGDRVLEVPNEYPNIQAAINASSDGDTVLVHDGTYLGNGNRDLDFGGRLIVLMSENGPDVTKLAVQGTEADRHRAFSFTNGEDTTAVVKGFRMEGGTYNIGGAVLIENSSPKFEDCIFYNNNNIPVGDIAYGGAMALSHSSSIIRDCLFANNRSAAGASIYASYGEPVIETCIFRDNTAQPVTVSAHAAGIYLSWCNAAMNKCLFYNNSSPKGTALTIDESSPHVEYCTFTRNGGSAEGSVIECVGGAHGSSPVISNCIIAFNDQCRAFFCGDVDCVPIITCTDIYGNTLGNWVDCIAEHENINGNIYIDPLFCSIASRDFHLARNSLCAPNNNFCGDLIGALDVGCGGRGTEVIPTLMYAYWAFSMETFYIDIYLYEVGADYSIYDVDTGAVMINGTMHPPSFEYIPETDSTQEALKMTLNRADFIVSYFPIWDNAILKYTISLSYTKDMLWPTQINGWTYIRGHISGDFNDDGSINLLDVIYLIRFLYHGGPMPVPEAMAADVDGSQAVNIRDVSYLVNYLFRGGPAPVEPEVTGH